MNFDWYENFRGGITAGACMQIVDNLGLLIANQSTYIKHDYSNSINQFHQYSQMKSLV